MGRSHRKTLILVCSLIFGACVKDKPQKYLNTTTALSKGSFVVCEGQFPTGHGSLYLIDPISNEVFGDVYEAANHAGIGFVFQSMTAINDKFFLCINNAHHIKVVAQNSYELIAQINVPFPRYMLPINDSIAYVSSLYHNTIYIINTATYILTDSIKIPTLNPEAMLLYNGLVYTTSWDTSCNNIYAINTEQKRVVQSLNIGGKAPHAILIDKEEMIWVLAGNEPIGCTATWTRLDPITGNINKVYTFPTDAGPIKPTLNATRDTLYYIEANYNGTSQHNGIFRMGIHTSSLPTTPLIPANANQYYWGLGIAPHNGHILIGDPVDFNQKGKVHEYDTEGNLLTTYKVGVGPGFFYFQ